MYDARSADKRERKITGRNYKNISTIYSESTYNISIERCIA